MQSSILFPISLVLFTSCISEPKTDSAVDSGEVEEATTVDVLLTTSMGEFVVELDIVNAPLTTENFLNYVDDGFFDGQDGLGSTVFHRVVADFVIQGGGYTADGVEKDTLDSIVNEAENGLSNLRGTVAMARKNDPDSATSQFFVNLVDNTFLNPGESTAAGYAVFGTVTSGMDIIDSIAGVSVDGDDKPLEPVVFESVTRMDD